MEEPVAAPFEYASFLVRIWRNTEVGAPGLTMDWQGEITHIQSSQRWTFESLDQMLGYLRWQVEKLAERRGKLSGEGPVAGQEETHMNRT